MVFAYKKATQILNYFARKCAGRKVDKLRALKLIFLADRYHIRKYGRSITNDNYIAMQYGPVASSVKDIADQTVFLGKEEKKYSAEYLHEKDDFHKIRSRREVDAAEFSQTELDALEFVWNRFHKLTSKQLIDLTHEFPEWKKHQQALGYSTRADMDILDFFEKAPESVEYCDGSQNIADLNKQHFQESLRIKELWR